MLVMDDWQKEFIDCKDDKILVAGRQTGKSEAQAYDNANFAATHPGTNALIISKTERQAEELLIKTLYFLQTFYPKQIGTGQWKPLKSTIWITHPGHTRKKPIVSRVMSLPVGLAGAGIRGYTIHKLSVDEAQLPPDPVFEAVLPMLLTTGGKTSLSGTPQGKQGFFWKAYDGGRKGTNQFKVFEINSEQVANNRPLSDVWTEFRKKEALSFLLKMKSTMSDKHYRQEYLGEFIEDLDQVFSDELIAKCCILNRKTQFLNNRKYLLGVDVGRTTDPSTFEILDAMDEVIEHVENRVRRDYSIPQTGDECAMLDSLYNFEKMGIDGGGLGRGVIDILLMPTNPMRYKAVDLDNSMRVVEKDTWEKKGKKKPLLKEDMYRNLQTLMLQGKIKLLKDVDVMMSLKSCQIEYKEGSDDPIIFGNDTHITEGLIRAAWLAKDKFNKLRFDYI